MGILHQNPITVEMNESYVFFVPALIHSKIYII